MKKVFALIVLLICYSSVAHAEREILQSTPTIISCSAEDALFYYECYNNARNNMCEPDKSDPELGYRTQAEYCNSVHESVRGLMAKNNELWGLASSNDLPRDEAITIGYAALEQIANVTRETMHMYYAEAWMNVSDPDRPIWKTMYSLATFYRRQNENADSFDIYIDSRTNEVLRVESY